MMALIGVAGRSARLVGLGVGPLTMMARVTRTLRASSSGGSGAAVHSVSMMVDLNLELSACDMGLPFRRKSRDFDQDLGDAGNVARPEQTLVEDGEPERAQHAEQQGDRKEHQRDRRASGR